MNKARVIQVSMVLMVLLGLWGVMRFGYSAYEKINYPYMVNLGEPPLAQAVQTLHAGESPYRELSSPPYTLVPYGPVYIALSSMMYFFSDQPFVGGRFVCLLATCLAAMMVFGLSYRSGARASCAMIAAMIFLLNPYAARWSVQVNVDMLGVALSAAALYLLMCFYEDRSRRKLLIAGGLCAVLAFFTKSSCLMGAAAFFFTLLTRRDYRLALLFFGVTASVAGALYGLMNVVTQGQYYFQTTYEISQRLFFWQFIVGFWQQALKDIPIPVIGSLIFLVWSIMRCQFGFVFWYLVFSILVTFSLGKQGSDTNYLLPWVLSSSVALGLLFERLLKQRSVIALVACGVFLFQVGAWADLTTPLTSAKAAYAEQKAYFDKISILIKQTPGKIISQDMSLLIANGRKIYYEPFPMGQMSYSGVWDQNLILEELRNKEYSLVILFTYAPVLKADRNFTPEFMKAFNANYQFKGRSNMPGGSGTLFFFWPKQA